MIENNVSDAKVNTHEEDDHQTFAPKQSVKVNVQRKAS